MLVFKRRFDESVMIGDQITCKVIEIKPDFVRLGFEAPGDVPIHRQEVFESIKREGRKKDADDSTDD